MLKTIASASAMIVGSAGGVESALAQSSATATIAVSIQVTPSCTVAAEPLNFGSSPEAQATSLAATASITVACGPDVPFTVALDDGKYASSTTRRAFDPATGGYIGYEIFADAAHTRRWGSLATEAVAGTTGGLGSERLTAYGLVDSNTQTTTGRYGDLVTVTTNF